MRPQTIALVAALVLLAGLPPPSTGQDATIEPPVPPQIPWWGPEDPIDGWSLRVPVTVTNPTDRPLTNAPAIADLDLGELALEAGWPAGTTGERTFLKSFTLDPESVRVVEYTNFRLPRTQPSDARMVEVDPSMEGPSKHIVPSVVREGFLEAEQGRPYDPSTHPVVSVTWLTQGTLEPGEERTYMVYADVEEAGDHEPQDPERVQEELGGLYWISRGTRLFGSGTQVTVTGLHRQTSVTVHTYEGQRPTAHEPASGTSNPFTVHDGRTQTYTIGAEPRPFMLTASKPIVATAQVSGGTQESKNRDTGFVPSADATLRGTQFTARVNPGPYYLYTDSPLGVSGTLNGERISGSGPVHEVVVSTQILELETDQPVLVQGRPDLDTYQFADLETGAPVGDNLVGTAFGTWWSSEANRGSGGRVQESGSVLLHALDDPVSVRGHTTEDDPQRIIPAQSAGASSGVLSLDADSWTQVQQRDSWGFEPISVSAVNPSNPAQLDDEARLMAIGGPPANKYGGGDTELASALGGEQAQRFATRTPVHVFAFHDGTQVTSTGGPRDTATLLDGGERLTLEASSQQPRSIEATKPIAVVPQNTIAYLPGLLEGLEADPLGLQYRGHLVQLAPAGDAQEPVVETGAFGDTVTFQLEARNTGQRADGSPLTDTIRFDVPPAPPGWNTTLDPRKVTLSTGEQVLVNLTVRTPTTRDLDEPLRLPVRATSQGNPNMTATVETVTVLQENRDVGLWYEARGGPQQTLTRFAPGQTQVIDLVVGNEGSSPDEIRLTQAGVQAGWSMRIEDNGTLAPTVELGAGQTRRLALVVTAPPPGGVILPTSSTITAASMNDTSAAEKVLFDGIVLAESDIGLESPERVIDAHPGETATFDLTLSNDGNRSADVRLNLSAELPAGWDEPSFLFQGESLAPVDNRIGDVRRTVDLELALPVPENAIGRLHLKLLATATDVSGSGQAPVALPLHLFVQPRVSLDVASPPRTVVPPGTSASLNATLTNTGNVNATLPVRTASAPVAWTVDHPDSLHASPQAPTRLPIHVSIPAGHAPLNRSLEVIVTLPNGTAVPVPATIEVPPWQALDIRPSTVEPLIPGVPTNLTIPVKATGNRPVDVLVQASAPEGWRVAAEASPPRLPPLAEGTIHLTVTPPRDAIETTHTIELTPSGRAAPDQGTATLELTPRRPDLALDGVQLTQAEGGPPVARGQLVNHADVTVENVTIALVDGDRILSTVSVSKVSAGTPRMFAIEVPETVDPVGLAVTADPVDRLPETDEANNQAPLTAPEGTNPSPGLPGLAILALAALSTLLARRAHGRER